VTVNILHIVPYYAPAWGYGGVVRAVTELSKAQVGLGQHVHVLTTDSLSPGQRIAVHHEVIDGVTVIRQPNRIEPLRRVNLSTPIGWTAALNTIAQSDQLDVIHCHELRTVETLLTMRSAAAHRSPVIVTPHGTLPLTTGRSAIKRGWDRLFGAALARRISGWVALNPTEANDIRAWWSRHAPANRPCPPIAVLPNGVDVDAFDWPRQATDHDPAAPIVLFLGRLQERKGVQFLIPAFARAIRELRLPRAMLVIAGPDEGMLVPAQQLADQYGIADQVTFAGLLTGAARDHALRQADVFVLPAIGEGLPMAALEAMAAALPVILTPGCQLPEVTTRGAGVIVDRSSEAIATALIDLLSQADRRNTMGAAGRSWMRESFSWAHIAAATITLYQNQPVNQSTSLQL